MASPGRAAVLLLSPGMETTGVGGAKEKGFKKSAEVQWGTCETKNGGMKNEQFNLNEDFKAAKIKKIQSMSIDFNRTSDVFRVGKSN